MVIMSDNEPLGPPDDMPDEPMESELFLALDIPSKDTEPRPQVDRMTTTSNDMRYLM